MVKLMKEKKKDVHKLKLKEKLFKKVHVKKSDTFVIMVRNKKN